MTDDERREFERAANMTDAEKIEAAGFVAKGIAPAQGEEMLSYPYVGVFELLNEDRNCWGC